MAEIEGLESENLKNRLPLGKMDLLVPLIIGSILGIIKVILELAANEDLNLNWKGWFISFLKQILELPHIGYLLFIFFLIWGFHFFGRRYLNKKEQEVAHREKEVTEKAKELKEKEEQIEKKPSTFPVINITNNYGTDSWTLPTSGSGSEE
jgi:hypothetical protein